MLTSARTLWNKYILFPWRQYRAPAANFCECVVVQEKWVEPLGQRISRFEHVAKSFRQIKLPVNVFILNELASHSVNLLQPGVAFLYSLKTENLKVVKCFARRVLNLNPVLRLSFRAISRKNIDKKSRTSPKRCSVWKKIRKIAWYL